MRYTIGVVSDYRRSHVPGGSFFFTVVTEGRANLLCTPEARYYLRLALRECRRRWPFQINALVLLRDHLHTIWTLPEDDSDYSRRWAWIKKEFTKSWLAHGGEQQEVSGSRRRRRQRGVWQKRFWEHTLSDPDDFEKHFDYIHYNPVKHGLVQCARDWSHSTFHRYVRLGVYPSDWGCRDTPPILPDLTPTAGE